MTETMTAAEYRELAKKPKKRAHKFNAQKTVVDGVTFASKAEATRYSSLKNLERARVIRSLGLQPRFPLHVGGESIGEFVADFVYFESGRLIVEDCKGHMTPTFRWKRKHFLAEYPHTELRVTNAKGAVKTIRTRKASQRKAA